MFIKPLHVRIGIHFQETHNAEHAQHKAIVQEGKNGGHIFSHGKHVYEVKMVKGNTSGYSQLMS